MLRKLMYLIFPAWIFVAFCKHTKRGKDSILSSHQCKHLNFSLAQTIRIVCSCKTHQLE